MKDQHASAKRENDLKRLTDFLLKYSKGIIFLLILIIGTVLLVSNWNAVYFDGIRSWYVLLPVTIFFATENAVKLWALRNFNEKIAFYVMDVVALLLLTIFSNGSLISTLYIIILSDFYLSQQKLKSNAVMGVSCIVIFLVTFAVSGSLKGEEVNIISIISSAVNDLLLIGLHFFVLNFAIQIYLKNRELAVALDELNESNEKLQKAYLELQEITALEERQRIAKEIHDTAGHSITTVIMQTEAARLVVESDPQEAKRKIDAANLQAKHALEELRESVHLLSGQREGQTLRDQLLEIVHDSTDGTDIAVRYDIDDVTLCDAKRRFFLNALKEGISNGLRHGGATAFWFELKREGDTVRFLLSDNGTGLEISELKEGFGLTAMSRRAASLGGEVWFETEPEEGFEIHVTMPADGKEEES